MSRRDASDTVSTRSLRRIALPIISRAYRGASRFGRYSGNSRWMQSWMVTTERCRQRSGST